MVERVLADSGLEPGFLDMEVTESIIISTPTAPSPRSRGCARWG